jgi:hypothetical protein
MVVCHKEVAKSIRSPPIPLHNTAADINDLFHCMWTETDISTVEKDEIIEKDSPVFENSNLSTNYHGIELRTDTSTRADVWNGARPVGIGFGGDKRLEVANSWWVDCRSLLIGGGDRAWNVMVELCRDNIVEKNFGKRSEDVNGST